MRYNWPKIKAMSNCKKYKTLTLIGSIDFNIKVMKQDNSALIMSSVSFEGEHKTIQFLLFNFQIN